MKNSKAICEKYNVVPRLRLGRQKKGGGVKGTGPHTVTLIRDKIAKDIDIHGEEKYCMWYYVEEDGQEKRYRHWLFKDPETKEVSYLIKRMSPIPKGTVVVMELARSKGGNKGFIRVEPIKEASQEKPDIEDDIPVINEEDYPNEDESPDTQ